MKKKLSVSIEEGTLSQMDYFLRQGTFRNKSHLIEFALNKFIKEERK